MYDPDKYKAVRTTPHQARGKERVRQILSTSLELFKANGIEVVTTNDIARTAGIPIGSLYRYFPNKAAIVAALTTLYVDDISDLFKEIGTRRAFRYLSWDEVFFLVVGAWVNYARLNGGFALLYTVRANPRLAAQNAATLARFTEAFVGVLRKRCPAVSARQGQVCFALCMAAAELGITDPTLDVVPGDLYHEAVGVVAAYMLRHCGTCEHDAGDMLG